MFWTGCCYLTQTPWLWCHCDLWFKCDFSSSSWFMKQVLVMWLANDLLEGDAIIRVPDIWCYLNNTAMFCALCGDRVRCWNDSQWRITFNWVISKDMGHKQCAMCSIELFLLIGHEERHKHQSKGYFLTNHLSVLYSAGECNFVVLKTLKSDIWKTRQEELGHRFWKETLLCFSNVIFWHFEQHKQKCHSSPLCWGSSIHLNSGCFAIWAYKTKSLFTVRYS